MEDGIRTRLLVLVGLIAVSIGLAGIGAAFGMAEPLPSDSSGEFVVAEDNITFKSSSESKTVVENLSHVREVNIKETDTGQFTIQTVEEQPLTDRERERAREVALANETVSAALSEMDSYELSVDSIQQLNASAFNQVSYDSNMSHGTSDEITIVETSEEEDNGSITITREPSYVEDRAVVRIRQPDAPQSEDLKYSVDVDLVTGTVTDITDWDAIRQKSSTVTATGKLNVTKIGK
jgi:hypothetical protein